ncbi:MAG: hypothetical protein ABI478_12540, partial [Propionivibrio sp.]
GMATGQGVVDRLLQQRFTERTGLQAGAVQIANFVDDDGRNVDLWRIENGEFAAECFAGAQGEFAAQHAPGQREVFQFAAAGEAELADAHQR